MKNRKGTKVLLMCAIIAVFLLRVVWIYMPSMGTVTFMDPETGVTIEEALTREEVIAVKKILWGRIHWPEWLYGYPACAFDSNFSVVINGRCYMPAWCCGMVAVEENGDCRFMNVTEKQCEILQEIISSAGE